MGTVEAVYIGRTLFSCIDFLAFAVALAGGYVLAVRMKRCRIGTAVLVVFVPLILVWLSQGAVVEIFSSLLAGGSALFLGMGAVGAVRAVRAHRAVRLSTAPDPYLEDAPEPAPPPSAREAGADDASAGACPSVMEEEPATEAGGAAGADPNGKKGS